MMALKKGIKDLVAEAEAEVETLSLARRHRAAWLGRFDVRRRARRIRELERDGMNPRGLSRAARHARILGRSR